MTGRIPSSYLFGSRNLFSCIWGTSKFLSYFDNKAKVSSTESHWNVKETFQSSEYEFNTFSFANIKAKYNY